MTSLALRVALLVLLVAGVRASAAGPHIDADKGLAHAFLDPRSAATFHGEAFLRKADERAIGDGAA